MDIWRLIFAGILGFSLLMLFRNYEIYEQQQRAAIADQQQTIAGESLPATGTTRTTGAVDGGGDLPQPTQRFAAPEGTVGEEGDVPTAAAKASTARDNLVHVETDWLSAAVSENGGNLVALRLKKHLQDGEPLLFLQDGERQYIAQSGLIGVENAPNHNHAYRYAGDLSASPRVLDDSADSLTVDFTAEAEGVALTKRYVFQRGSYLISVALIAENHRDTTENLFGYFQLAHDGALPTNYSSILPSFFGAAVYTDADKFTKIPFDDIGDDDYPRKSRDGWIGIIQRYFAAVWLPPETREREFFIRPGKAGGARVGFITPLGELAPGEKHTLSARIFAGAQEQRILNALDDSGAAPGINLVVDYGWLTFIAVLLFKLLIVIQGAIPNWGVAIILLTLSVKLLFYPLSSAAYRSMAKIKGEAPRIKALQEKFANDKRRLQEEMMSLYREKKINPLGGCLPILVQIPVFIALYWVLLGSVELRQAPFLLWIEDLSTPDPYYILSLIMGGTMFLQTRMSPAPPDPTQAMIMRLMPIGFAVFSIFFPSGLVLYWAVNTILSIAQQWYITRSIKKAADKKK